MEPRRLAFDVLKKTEKSGQYSNIALDHALRGVEMSEADRGLFTVICMGVIERRLTLDYYIDKLADKPDEIEPDTRILLRIGLYQLMFLDRVPQYAAINETVSLSPKKTRGFVNAILRSYQRKGDKIELPSKERGVEAYVSVKHSFPIEFCKRFIEIFGLERTEAIFEKFNGAPPMTLRINTLKISRDDYAQMLEQSGVSYEYTQYAPNGIKVNGGAYTRLPGADEGLFFVQDEASQLCVEAVGAKEGDFLIDTCSCPGSKSFGCAINMKNTGRMLSCDLHKSKLSLVESGAKRLGIEIISTQERDGRCFDSTLEGEADAVLCDAPCSGLGVVAKKPEIRYKDLSESDKLPKIQLDILENVSRYVKIGGTLVYSTCTLFEDENGGVIKEFLSKNKSFEPVEFSFGDICSQDGMLTLTPDGNNTDGFFIAKMRRI